MRSNSVHSRICAAGTVDQVGALIDSLATPDDELWPDQHWPAMKLDRPLGTGAIGGHGPIRYRVVRCEPTRRVRFSFIRPTGFHGYHAFEARPVATGCALRHALVMDTTGLAVVGWPLIWRPLHDTLIENALDKAAAHLTCSAPITSWSRYVRTLRRAATLLGVSRHQHQRRPARIGGA